MNQEVLCRNDRGSGVHVEVEAVSDSARTVRILCAGVCGTDIQIARGERSDAARILGHEAVGSIDGELVVFNPVDPGDQDQILGHSYHGVFCSRYPMGAVPSPHLVSVPAGLPSGLCALCEPVAAAIYGWELVPETPVRVGIWGAGPMGLLHAFLALERGASVLLVHPSVSRLDWAGRHLLEGAFERALPGQAGGPDIDLAMLCTDRAGTAGALAEAVNLLRPGGTLVLVGGVPRGYRSLALPDVDLDAVRRSNTSGGRGDNGGITEARTADSKRVGVTGHRGTSDSQIRAAYDLISAQQPFFERFVTHPVRLPDAVELINRRCRGQEQDDTGAEIVKIVISLSD